MGPTHARVSMANCNLLPEVRVVGGKSQWPIMRCRPRSPTALTAHSVTLRTLADPRNSPGSHTQLCLITLVVQAFQTFTPTCVTLRSLLLISRGRIVKRLEEENKNVMRMKI
jgi:hypothetical protein